MGRTGACLFANGVVQGFEELRWGGTPSRARGTRQWTRLCHRLTIAPATVERITGTGGS